MLPLWRVTVLGYARRALLIQATRSAPYRRATPYRSARSGSCSYTGTALSAQARDRCDRRDQPVDPQDRAHRRRCRTVQIRAGTPSTAEDQPLATSTCRDR